MERYHDYKILGLRFDEQKMILVIFCLSPNGENENIIFEEVHSYYFDTITKECYILRIHCLNGSEISTETIESYEVSDDELKVLKDPNVCFFLILAEGGMDGYVISRKLSDLS